MVDFDARLGAKPLSTDRLPAGSHSHSLFRVPPTVKATSDDEPTFRRGHHLPLKYISTPDSMRSINAIKIGGKFERGWVRKAFPNASRMVSQRSRYRGHHIGTPPKSSNRCLPLGSTHQQSRHQGAFVALRRLRLEVITSKLHWSLAFGISILHQGSNPGQQFRIIRVGRFPV